MTAARQGVVEGTGRRAGDAATRGHRSTRWDCRGCICTLQYERSVPPAAYGAAGVFGAPSPETEWSVSVRASARCTSGSTSPTHQAGACTLLANIHRGTRNHPSRDARSRGRNELSSSGYFRSTCPTKSRCAFARSLSSGKSPHQKTGALYPTQETPDGWLHSPRRLRRAPPSRRVHIEHTLAHHIHATCAPQRRLTSAHTRPALSQNHVVQGQG